MKKICKLCKNKIEENDSYFFANDNIFCTESCRELYLAGYKGIGDPELIKKCCGLQIM